jgi:5-deoxy-5-amino-3-dehydroquinate synthase
LATLSKRELRSGFGEVAKYRLLQPDRDWHQFSMPELVSCCIDIKLGVVSGDPTEDTSSATGRVRLNYGHTLAHALEATGAFELSHGEAVAVGLIFAAQLGYELGRVDESVVDTTHDVVGGYDLPIKIPTGYEAHRLIDYMTRDKKATEGLSFVLDGPTGIELVRNVDIQTVESTLIKCGAQR